MMDEEGLLGVANEENRFSETERLVERNKSAAGEDEIFDTGGVLKADGGDRPTEGDSSAGIAEVVNRVSRDEYGCAETREVVIGKGMVNEDGCTISTEMLEDGYIRIEVDEIVATYGGWTSEDKIPLSKKVVNKGDLRLTDGEARGGVVTADVVIPTKAEEDIPPGAKCSLGTTQ